MEVRIKNQDVQVTPQPAVTGVLCTVGNVLDTVTICQNATVRECAWYIFVDSPVLIWDAPPDVAMTASETALQCPLARIQTQNWM